MYKTAFCLTIIGLVFILNISTVFADDRPGVPNGPCGIPPISSKCCNALPPASCVVDGSYQCLPWTSDTGYAKGTLVCQESSVGKIFGTIEPPPALAGFLQKDSTGASAISDFLSRFITLLFSIAAIVLIFMIIWGAFEWLTSGGDKEKLSAAQKRIINAIIGIILFAAAFAIIQVLGIFTGFRLFKGQGVTTRRDPYGNIEFICPNGDTVNYPTNDPDVACKGRGT